MKDRLKLISLFVFLLISVLVTEKLFHHSFEKFILSAFQRIEYDPSKFSKRITIIDTSPIYDLTMRRTNRAMLAALLQAVKLGQPQSVGLDIRLDPDSMYRDEIGDSLLKSVLFDWNQIVIPSGADPYFGITDSRQIANIQIQDGYEIPVSKKNILSMPFQMAASSGLGAVEDKSTFIVNYQATYGKLSGTDQLINADQILKIYYAESLATAEKQDEIALMLASQFVFIGFCNEALNVDRHQTPFGEQPGVIIWANTMNNVLNPGENIKYFPIWILFVWALLTLLLTMGLKKVQNNYNFFYVVALMGAVLGQILFWFLAGAMLYFSSHIYIPVFSFILIGIFAFPIFQQVDRFFIMMEIMIEYPKIKHLPAPLKSGYLEYLKQSHPFKKLHIGFTLIEECIRFSALLGLAQGFSHNINLKGVIPTKNWDRTSFSRLTFGEWHHIMRSLSKHLKDNNNVLDQWKMIYREKNKKNHQWKPNDLLKNLDDDFDALKDIAVRESERKELSNNIESIPTLSRRITLFLLKLLKQKWILDSVQIFKKHESKISSQIIEQKFGKIQNLIHFRNRIVHDGGSFMRDKDVQEIEPKIKPWLNIFLKEKYKFWKDVQLSAELNDGIEQLYFKLHDKIYTLTPFFEFQYEENHIKINEDLFLLAVIDDKKKRLVYFGTGHNNRFEKEDAGDICERIFEMLDVPKK